MIGIIIYTFDLFGKESKVKERTSVWSDVYNLFCSVVGIVIISWLMYDIHKYLTWMRDFYLNGEEDGGGAWQADVEQVVQESKVTGRICRRWRLL